MHLFGFRVLSSAELLLMRGEAERSCSLKKGNVCLTNPPVKHELSGTAQGQPPISRLGRNSLQLDTRLNMNTPRFALENF